jgi:hypothetical protein
MGVVANVISGPANLFVLQEPTTPTYPTLTGAASDFLSAGFADVGFTDKGIEFDYASTDKDIDVDELTSPVDVLITGEKLTVSLALAETTLTNLFYAISGGTLVSADEVTIGGKIRPTRFILGIIGPAPVTATAPLGIREALIYRAIPKGTVKMHYQRKDKLMYQANFQALGLDTLALGANLCDIKDF